MNSQNIRKHRQNNEEKQMKNSKHMHWLGRKSDDIQQVYRREQLQNERLLQYFEGSEAFAFFAELTQETSFEEQRFLNSVEEGQDVLEAEKRNLQREADDLYAEELKVLKEEETTNGKDGRRGSSNANK